MSSAESNCLNIRHQRRVATSRLGSNQYESPSSRTWSILSLTSDACSRKRSVRDWFVNSTNKQGSGGFGTLAYGLPSIYAAVQVGAHRVCCVLKSKGVQIVKKTGRCGLGVTFAVLLQLAWGIPAYANGKDLAVYQGIFNNLDQNLGSYMFWTMTFGDASLPANTQYAPFGFDFTVPPLRSQSWAVQDNGAGIVTDQQFCNPNPFNCFGPIDSANFNVFDTPPGFGVFSKWFFVDRYYPGVQNFEFHFTDPPGGNGLAPAPFKLVEQNFLANNTPFGSPEEFSLTVNPDGSIHDVSATGMTLSQEGSAQTPEPRMAPVLGAAAFLLLAARRWLRN
jgi:hypothetical protein